MGIFPLANSLLILHRRRGAYYGIIGGVWAIASSLGPIVGGAFTEKVTWRWYVIGPCSITALALTFCEAIQLTNIPGASTLIVCILRLCVCVLNR